MPPQRSAAKGIMFSANRGQLQVSRIRMSNYEKRAFGYARPSTFLNEAHTLYLLLDVI